MTEILSELGRRLSLFGEGEAHRAAANIARDMLSREALAQWGALYPALPVETPRSVLVIMAGNIPFVGMHDLVCVLAAGHRAIVKPSSKDFENIAWVVEQLLDIAPGLPVSLISNDNFQLNAVVAMGSDDTVAAIADRYAGLPMLLRGNRSSAAVLDGSESGEELVGLAGDVLAYSGLGCRNVSLLWVPRGYDFTPLQNVMARWADSLSDKYTGNLRQARAMLRMGAVPHIDAGTVLLTENRDFPAQPSVLNYTFYDDPQEIRDWIASHDDEIQCVATNYPFPIIHFPLNRVVKLGTTQRPGLTDYPDGLDTMQFLAGI